MGLPYASIERCISLRPPAVACLCEHTHPRSRQWYALFGDMVLAKRNVVQMHASPGIRNGLRQATLKIWTIPSSACGVKSAPGMGDMQTAA